MMSAGPYGFTIFSDDVREEVGGKQSIMGIYRGDIIISGDFPVTLPKFCLTIAYRLPNDDTRTGNVDLLVYLPGDRDEEPTVRTTIDVARAIEEISKRQPEDQSGGAFREFNAIAILAPFTIKEERQNFPGTALPAGQQPVLRYTGCPT